MVTATRFKKLEVGDRKNAATGEAQAFGGAVVAQSNTIAFGDDGSAVDICVIPPKSQIIEIYVDVLTAFDGSGTDVLDIGVSGTANQFADNLDLSSAGRVLGSSDASQLANYDDIGDSQITIQATYTDANSDAAAGSARITVVYVVGNDLE